MLKQNTAITARRCSTAITLVLRRPNTQWHAEGAAKPSPARIRGITRVVTSTGTSKTLKSFTPLICEPSQIRGVFVSQHVLLKQSGACVKT